MNKGLQYLVQNSHFSYYDVLRISDVKLAP